MNAHELIREIDKRAEVPAVLAGEMTLFLSRVLRTIAEKFYELELANGARLSDALSATTFFHEAALAIYVKPKPATSRWNETCPRCGHVHEGDAECGQDMGGGRRCRCEMEVLA